VRRPVLESLANLPETPPDCDFPHFKNVGTNMPGVLLFLRNTLGTQLYTNARPLADGVHHPYSFAHLEGSTVLLLEKVYV
jgi:hypothetical protein